MPAAAPAGATAPCATAPFTPPLRAGTEIARYGVVGHPVEHSLSPRIHAAFAQQSGQAMCYEKLLAPREDFAGFVTRFFAQGGSGCNVTVPFKEDAYHWLCAQSLHTLSARAAAARAVNTLWGVDTPQGRHWQGDNTDGLGLVRDLRAHGALEKTCVLEGQSVLLLGAGGASRGVLLPLLEAGVGDLWVANRTAGKARQLVEELQARLLAASAVRERRWSARLHWLPLEIQALEAAAHRTTARDSSAGTACAPPFSVIINATSSGLSAAELPLPAALWSDRTKTSRASRPLAYEMVYGKPTPFLTQAHSGGAHCRDGLGMLIEQAAESFRLWRGISPDTAAVRQVLRAEFPLAV